MASDKRKIQYRVKERLNREAISRIVRRLTQAQTREERRELRAEIDRLNAARYALDREYPEFANAAFLEPTP